MKAPLKQIIYLKDKCPICKYWLYAYWHTPMGDRPELGEWTIECNDGECKYEYEYTFSDVESLAKKFNVTEKFY